MTPLLERKPTAEEVAEEMDVPKEHIEALLQAQTEDIPLETMSGDDSDFSLLDKIEQSSMPPLDQALQEESFRGLLMGMLTDLEERERKILTLRYGLDGQEPRTLKEVGKVVGLSRERVRQIETKTLKKLRHHAKKKQLMGYLN
jgi:RNA polymerase primary sigma factor